MGEPQVGVGRLGEEVDRKWDLGVEGVAVGGDWPASDRNLLLGPSGDLESHGPRLGSEGDEDDPGIGARLEGELGDRQRRPVASEGAPGRELEVFFLPLHLPLLIPGRRACLACTEIDLEPSQLRAVLRLRPGEAGLNSGTIDVELIALLDPSPVGKGPPDVDQQPRADALLGQLAVGDDMTGGVTHRGEAVERALAVASGHGGQVGRRAKQQEDCRDEELHRVKLAIAGANAQSMTLKTP